MVFIYFYCNYFWIVSLSLILIGVCMYWIGECFRFFYSNLNV